jgi:hypothetical protein
VDSCSESGYTDEIEDISASPYVEFVCLVISCILLNSELSIGVELELLSLKSGGSGMSSADTSFRNESRAQEDEARKAEEAKVKEARKKQEEQDNEVMKKYKTEISKEIKARKKKEKKNLAPPPRKQLKYINSQTQEI